MEICFLLPGYSHIPIGGYKLVYQYATALKKRGFNVVVVHIEHSKQFPGGKNSISNFTRQHIKKIMILTHIINKSKIKWINLDKVNCLFLTKFSLKKIPKADIYISTSWQTNFMINEIKRENKTASFFYFIQGYETWDTSEKNVIASWDLPINRILISNYLANIADALGLSYSIVPNFFDEREFFVDVPVNNRKPLSILFMYHPSVTKNFILTLNLVERLYNVYGDKIEFSCFSVYKKPDSMPNYVHYYRNPSKKELRERYNNAAIFLSTSTSEGWGMTTMEAMACGCAVVSTDNGGINNYAVSGRNSIICNDDNKIFQNILELFKNNQKRISIGECASSDVLAYSLTASVKKLIFSLIKK